MHPKFKQHRYARQHVLSAPHRYRQAHPSDRRPARRVCIVGVSGKLGQYMAQHALDRGYEVVGVCRAGSVAKLGPLQERITVVPGSTNDREVIKQAVADCDGVLTVLVPIGRERYPSGTAHAVLDLAPPGARLIFSSGWHITRTDKKSSPWKVRALVLAARLAKLAGRVDLDDQVEACQRIFASDTDWTLVRASDLEEGESQGLPAWSRHVGDPILRSNITRGVDLALFMVDALTNDELIHEAPAIVCRQTPSALAHARLRRPRGDAQLGKESSMTSHISRSSTLIRSIAVDSDSSASRQRQAAASQHHPAGAANSRYDSAEQWRTPDE